MVATPLDWNEIDATDWEAPPPEEIEKLPAGPQLCKIIDVQQGTSRNGNRQLLFMLEIAEGKFAGLFKKMHDRKRYFDDNARWPCIFYQPLTDGMMARLKHIVNVCTLMNPKFPPRWGEGGRGDERQFIGCLVGVMFREEEYESGGALYTNTRPAFIGDWSVVQTQKPPRKKLAKGYKPPAPTPTDDDGEEVPF